MDFAVYGEVFFLYIKQHQIWIVGCAQKLSAKIGNNQQNERGTNLVCFEKIYFSIMSPIKRFSAALSQAGSPPGRQYHRKR